jgi:hypothetical protein
MSHAQTSGQQPLITQPIDETKLAPLPGNTHPLARAEFDHGAAPANLAMQRMLLVLGRSATQEAALETLLEKQQDKTSANFHKWLTPDEFGQQFGISEQDVQTIISWLEGHGFEIAGISRGRGVIEFSGTAQEVQQAFHTAIHSYAVNGGRYWANASDPEIPSALAPAVIGIDSLNNFGKKAAHHLAGITARQLAGEWTKAQPALTYQCANQRGYGCAGLLQRAGTLRFCGDLQRVAAMDVESCNQRDGRIDCDCGPVEHQFAGRERFSEFVWTSEQSAASDSGWAGPGAGSR